MSDVKKHKSKKKDKKNKHRGEDDQFAGNMANIDGMGEVGKPDWMESDDSDDGKITNNRNNFDLGRPPSRTLNNFKFIQINITKVLILIIYQFY
jgi:hypothetical protein